MLGAQRGRHDDQHGGYPPSDGQTLKVIEAYPAACKRSAAMAAMKAKDDESVVVGLGHADLDDALTCALIAWLFHCQPELLWCRRGQT